MKKNKKILFATQIWIFGGAELYFLDVIRGMKSRGYVVEVYIIPYINETGLKQFCDELVKATVKYSIIPMLTGTYSHIIRQRLRDFQKIKPDIVHFNQGGPRCMRLEMAAAYKLNIPFVATSHSPSGTGGTTKIRFPKTPSGLREWAYSWEADEYIVVSDKNKEILSSNKGIQKQKIHVIHNGLKFEKFKRVKRNHDILSTFGIQPNHFVIGSLGNLNWTKAHDILIMAAAEVLKTGLSKKVQFVICGTGEKIQELKNLIKKYRIETNFKLVGHINYALIPEVLSRFDIFCMSSDVEGQPYAILEALLAGVPVVSTAVGGVIDIVENGKNGFLVRKGDYIEMAKKLTDLVENDSLRERLASNTVNSIDDRYKMSTMLDKTEGLYRKLCGAAQKRKVSKSLKFRYLVGEIVDYLWPLLGPTEKYLLQFISKISKCII